MRIIVATVVFCLAALNPAVGQGLGGSKGKIAAAYEYALSFNLFFLSEIEEIGEMVDSGGFVLIFGNENYRIDKDVMLPIVLPETKVFLERFSAQYRRSCGEELVVTGALRPAGFMLWNSSPLSVHPTGMALDLRLSKEAKCRAWADKTLISLNRKGVTIATRERNPPHYHIVVLPQEYSAYVAELTSAHSSR